MKAKGTTILAGLLCMLLGACNSTNPNGTSASRSGESYSSTAGTGQSGSATGNSGSSGSTAGTNRMGSTGSMDRTGSTAATTSSTMSNSTNSGDTSGSADARTATANNAMNMDGSQSGVSIASATVQSIDTVPRGMDQGSGETQAGSSGTAGSTSGSMMYRVTLRLDDGTTRAIMQNSQPTYQIGDRVKVVNGLLQRY